jgi:hypothetical protein
MLHRSALSGVFAPNAKQRHLIITRHSSATAPGSGAGQVQPGDATPSAAMNWCWFAHYFTGRFSDCLTALGGGFPALSHR